MSIENSDLDLDQVPPLDVPGAVSVFEDQKRVLVKLSASVENRPRIEKAFCVLRASGLSSLLFVKAPPAGSETSLVEWLSFLKEWDQLLLRNVLELVGSRIPAAYSESLAQEAKTELKWFQEWQTAVSDPRVHRYPGLPWRSFLRKVNAENFAFAVDLLESSDAQANADRTRRFLTEKKKTICVFPKNWRGR